MAARTQDPSPIATVLGFAVFIWILFFLDLAITGITGYCPSQHLGVRPHEPWGLVGILTAHFFHAWNGGPPQVLGISFAHILSNTIALVPLLFFALVECRNLAWVAFFYSMLGAGTCAWVFSSGNVVHIGISGVIFGLIGFLIANGILRRSLGAFVVAVLVLVVFGGALWLVLPSPEHPVMSWQMHLGGLIGGLIASWHLRHEKPRG